MLSLTVFGIATGLSYVSYLDRSKTCKMLNSATDVSDGGNGIRYTSGYLSGEPFDFGGKAVFSLATKRYEVLQKIEVFNGSAFTTSKKVFKDMNFRKTDVKLNNVDVSNLMNKLHSQYAVKLDEQYETQSPVNMHNLNMTIGRIKINAQNEVLSGYLRKYYGLRANPHKFYTIVGPFHDNMFYDENQTIISENRDINTMRNEAQSHMSCWKWLSVGFMVSGIVCGTYEVMSYIK